MRIPGRIADPGISALTDPSSSDSRTSSGVRSLTGGKTLVEDLITVEQNPDPDAGPVEADLVSDHEDADHRPAARDQPDITVVVLGALGDIDQRSRKDHLVGIDADPRRGAQVGQPHPVPGIPRLAEC